MNAQTLYTEAKTAQQMLQQVLDNAGMREMERSELQDIAERMTRQFEDVVADGKRGRYAPRYEKMKENVMGINATPSIKQSHLMSATAYAAKIAEKFGVKIDTQASAVLTEDEFNLCNAVNVKWGLEEVERNEDTAIVPSRERVIAMAMTLTEKSSDNDFADFYRLIAVFEYHILFEQWKQMDSLKSVAVDELEDNWNYLPIQDYINWLAKNARIVTL